MSSFALTPQIADAALPELVAQLLTAQWPRVHSRSNFESNEILYQIITQLKGWIMAITDEVIVFPYFKELFYSCRRNFARIITE